MHLPRPLPFVFSQSGARKEIVLYLQLNNTIPFLHLIVLLHIKYGHYHVQVSHGYLATRQL